MQAKDLFPEKSELDELLNLNSTDAWSAEDIRFRSLVDSLPVVVYAVRAEPPYSPLYVSPYIESLGYSEEEWFINPDLWLRLIHDDDRERIMRETEEAMSAGRDTDYEYRVITRDGSVRWFHDRGRVIRGDEGKAVYWQGVMLDITDLKQAETALLEANRRAITEYEHLLGRLAKLAEGFGSARDLLTVYRAILDFALASVPCVGLIISLYEAEREVRKCVYLWFDHQELNPSDIEPARVGHGPAGRAIRTNSVVVNNDFVKDVKEKVGYVAIGYDEDPRNPRSILLAPMTVMGRVVGTIEVQSYEPGAYRREHETAMRMAGSLAANVIENVRLLEQERQTEEQFRQSQKMEAIGKLAGGVAHDFNNLLTAINGYSDLSLRHLEPNNPVRRNVEQIKKAGQRASDLTRQLLAFSRKQMLQPKIININDVITDTSKMLRRLIGEDIEVVLHLKPSVGKVKADPSQIDQVLMNLVVNARDAMPHGGTLTIETANVEMEKSIADKYASVQSGPHVMISVADTGCGMTEEVQQHIFEPFFTTKGVGRGTGLGLSTVYGIVKQSDGYISVESEENKGTTFKIYLPRVDQAASVEVKKETIAPEPPRGTETILLVEDEEMVRNMTRTLLEGSG